MTDLEGTASMAIEEVRVLVVDDEPDTCEALGDLLRSYGYAVRCARSAIDALRVAEEQQPACVLMDLGMPGIDGCELALRLRAAHGHGLVLIAITGWSRQADRDRAEAAGVDFVLVKPITAAALQRFLPPLEGVPLSNHAARIED